MKIVVADNIDFEKKDIARLRELGEVKQYESHCKNESDVISRLQNADIGIVLVSPITKKVLKHCNKLKMLTIGSTGYDHVDLEEATKQDIVISNVPDYSEEAVAEHVFAMLLNFIRKLCSAHKNVISGNFDWEKFQSIELKGKTLGIYGLGNIGSRVAEIAKVFGMDVLAASRTHKSKLQSEIGFQYVSFNKLLRNSDILTIHAALNKNTKGKIGTKEFEKMKDKAIIINTSRGEIIKYDDLAEALEKAKISGACLDVFPDEPPDLENKIFQRKNVLFTPHMAFNTSNAMRACYEICIKNIESFIKGNPINVVNY